MGLLRYHNVDDNRLQLLVYWFAHMENICRGSTATGINTIPLKLILTSYLNNRVQCSYIIVCVCTQAHSGGGGGYLDLIYDNITDRDKYKLGDT